MPLVDLYTHVYMYIVPCTDRVYVFKVKNLKHDDNYSRIRIFAEGAATEKARMFARPV